MFHGLGGPASNGGVTGPSIDASAPGAPPVPPPPVPELPPVLEPPAPVATLDPVEPFAPATPVPEVELAPAVPDPGDGPASFDCEHATVAQATATTPTRLLMEL